MNRIEHTTEQIAAIHAEHSRYSVIAAAGSGKTSVLVERYIHLVEKQGVSPERILTITFTRKAAAEMKRRIIARLRSAAREEAARVAETGPIQTIHSYCERLLRENALAAGVDPQFEVMSEVATVERAALRAALQNPERSDRVKALIARLAGKNLKKGQTTMDAAVAELVEEVLGKLRGSGTTRQALREIYGSRESVLKHWQAEILKSLPPEIAAELGPLPVDRFSDALPEAFANTGLRVPPRFVRRLHSGEESAVSDAISLVELAVSAWERIEEHMTRAQRLDFAALEAFAVRLVEENAAVRDRVRSQFDAVLVDEAQDVNPMQDRLLKALGLESEMMVGDPQQSIYGFRDADRQLFIDRSTALPSESLTLNHRSAPGILRFVNRLFQNLWKHQYTPMTSPENGALRSPDYDGVEIWEMKGEDFGQVADYIAEMHREGVKLGAIAVLVRAHWVSRRIADELERRGLRSRIEGDTRGFYSRLLVRDIANALTALTTPERDHSMLALLRSPFVELSLDSVVLLAKRGDVCASLQDFDPPLEEDVEKLQRFQTWFDEISRHADRLPAWETMARLLRASPYLENLARRPAREQDLANVRKLLSLAADQSDAGSIQFAEAIREIQVLTHQMGDANPVDDEVDAVTIMTVHGAKGLEFDVVVVPDTHRPTRTETLMVVDARRALVVPNLESKSLYFEWAKHLHKTRNDDEGGRLLYVALTRACKRLCVVAHPAAKHGSDARLIAERTGYSIAKDDMPGLRIRLQGPSVESK